jgi:hypothetical protein
MWGVALLVGLLFALAAQPAMAVLPDLQNPGFENWTGSTLDTWTVQLGANAYKSAPRLDSGTNAVLFNDANTVASNASLLVPGSSLDASISVDQDGTYRFAAWVQSDRGAAAPALNMWFTDTAGTIIGGKHSVRGNQFGVTSSTWKQMDIRWVAPVGATRMVVQLAMYGGTGGGVRFDDAQLDEINNLAGTTDLYSGWTVVRSADMGSGFGVNQPAVGLAAFTAPGGLGRELNGRATVYRVFERPVDTVSYHISTNANWLPTSPLVPQTWSYIGVNGYVRSVCVTAGATEETVTLSGLNTNRIDFTCDAVRGPSIDNELVATISNVRAMSPIWRFRNRASNVHLMSADPAEKTNIETNLFATWEFEGVSYQINLANYLNQSPLWRFRNINGGHYLFTADVNEKNNIVSTLGKSWKLEGESFKVSTTPSGAPVWRFRNLWDDTYLYTADPNEKANIVASLSGTWLLEGIAYYVAP